MRRSDLELLTAVAAGDSRAFVALYNRHAPSVFGLLVTMLRRTVDAEDVLQETFLQAWRQAPRFDSTRSTPFSWLVMIARSRALDKLRQRPISNKSETPELPVLSDMATALERDETAAHVRTCLSDLPAEQRSAIELAFFGGLTYEQVAARQAIAIGTAKTRIRLGLLRLRKLLEPAEGNSK